MNELLTLLQQEAHKRGLIGPQETIDAAAAFRLVRDMPYRRASDRRPETTIREWQGTCSGKHYLLQALFAELGLPSRLIACTVELKLGPDILPPILAETLVPTDGRFVDVHNYLILDLPQGEMIVDATWPLATKSVGLTVNETFVLGQDQQISYPPQQKWEVPADRDPHAFKNELLQANFTPTELAARDAFIRTLSQLLKQLENSQSENP